ncbi:MAG: glycosyltransferase [Clostridiales bacterium]
MTTTSNELIFAIIVLYNKNYKDSLTYQSVKDQNCLHLIICDNSTADFGNNELLAMDGITYVDMGGNKGLSKAYNRGIDTITKKQGILCLFDDDTEIPADYFEKVRKYFKEIPADIYLPMVYDDVGLMSPGVMKKYICYRAHSLSDLPPNEFTGINSGMALKLALFENYRYDEHIFLDYIDHNFIREMRNIGKSMVIMKDVSLHQTFSDVVNSKVSAITRFKILKKDLKYFYRGSFRSYLIYCYVIGKRSIKLCLKYKTLGFLFL